MSLQFILGNSGSGKSSYLYKQILKEAQENPKQNYLVIVPEQFTMQTQRELVRLQENHAIMNVDVLSFARLAYRVFDELGKQNLVVLEETGKNLVLRKVAAKKQKNLCVLGGNMNKMGYISEVKSLISELTQYNISPEALQDFIRQEDLAENLRLKLQDVLVMYQGFSEFLRGRYITAEEVLSLLCDVAKESEIIRDSVIVFDEFTGFTPIQNQLFGVLLKLASKVLVTVTIDAKEDFYHCRGMQELFSLSKKTIATLLTIAGEEKIAVLDPVVLDKGAVLRYKEAPGLYFMEQNLFRPKHARFRQKKEEVQIFSCKDPKEELDFVAKEIAMLVRKESYCYKEIAVVTGDVTTYANYVPEIFEKYEIPYFIDQTKNILFHPLTEFIRAALEVVESDFSYESVFRFLRSGLSGIETAEIDALENYVIAKGIRGAKRYSTVWRTVSRNGKEDLDALNATREHLIALLFPFYEELKKKDSNTLDMTKALYQLLVSLEVERQLKDKQEEYEQAGDLAKAKEYAQIYKIVMDLLDKIVSLLGEEQLTIEEYSDILDAGFEAAKIGIIPPGNDKILVGDIERTRLNHIKVLFFVGVNDGIVPKAANMGGIISQFEREKMAEHAMELAPGARERVFIQKFYLYLNLTKPSRHLYVTYSKVNADGKAMRRSYLIGTLLGMFENLTVKEIDQEKEAILVTPKSSLNFLLEGLWEEEPSEAWRILANWYLSNPAYQKEVERLLSANCKSYEAEPISKAVVKALYGSVLTNSVTRLERFAACAFAHYLDYGLRLQEREEHQFASVDMGNIYHDALEAYAKKVKETGRSWSEIAPEEQERFITTCMDDAILKNQQVQVFEDARNGYLLNRMRETIKRTIWALTVQVQKGHFVPSEFEVSFERAGKLDAVHFTLSEEEKMQLKGRIDRIDLCETEDKVYVKIIDYKSGNTSFSLLNLYYGLQLQLVVYLNTAMEMMQKKYRKKQVEPAGIFYYHVTNPMVEGSGLESEEEIRRAVLEQLKLNGLVNENPDIYRQMDADFSGSSAVIPVATKADGSLKATSKVASTEDFQIMSDYVNQIIQKTGQKIYEGDVAVYPYQMEQKSGCDYCPYHTICEFDPRLPGYEYHRLEKIGKESDILAKMKGNE